MSRPASVNLPIYAGLSCEYEIVPGPIQIKRANVTEAVRKLARPTGVSLTDAVSTGVNAPLDVEQAKANRRRDAERVLARLRELPIIGPKLTDQDFYDTDGIPARTNYDD